MLREQGQPTYVDTDPLFDAPKNIDFSVPLDGIHKATFCTKFQPYLLVCTALEGIDVSGKLNNM